MTSPVRLSVFALPVVFATLVSGVLIAQAQRSSPSAAAQKPAAAGTAAPVPKRDLTGVWSFLPGDPSLSPVGSLTGVGRGPGEMPPLTEWGKKTYESHKPGYGPRMTGENNDPSLLCDPAGIPRLLFGSTFEFDGARDRVMQFFSTAWRPIWTDGRRLPNDPDPTWMGVSVGRWEDDYTFVVESAGFNDRTWLGQEGQPHSDEMKVTERWRRVDNETLTLNAVIDDPKTYTQPFKTIQITYKLRPRNYDMEFNPCVWSDENAFLNRIRKPAQVRPSSN